MHVDETLSLMSQFLVEGYDFSQITTKVRPCLQTPSQIAYAYCVLYVDSYVLSYSQAPPPRCSIQHLPAPSMQETPERTMKRENHVKITMENHVRKQDE